jgi:hypothetical protein
MIITGGAMSLLEAIENVLGFMVKQPLHVTLRQMRIVPVGLIISSQLLLWEIVRTLKLLDPSQAAMAFGAIAAALIAAIWKGVDSLHRSNIKDDE